MEQRLFLGERLLRDNDVASMACSLEQRVPLVDQVLFESVDRLPDQARYQPLGRKAILRRIGLRGLDPALFERPKSGFVLPFDRWIRQGLRKAMDETLRDPQAVAAVGLRPRSGRAALAELPRRGTRHVLVAGLVGLRLDTVVPPQPRLSLNGIARGIPTLSRIASEAKQSRLGSAGLLRRFASLAIARSPQGATKPSSLVFYAGLLRFARNDDRATSPKIIAL